jgi:hypothetical protein
MAQRLYNIGLLNEVHWSKNEGINSNTFQLDSSPIELDNHHPEQQYQRTRHLSSPAFTFTRRQSIFRNENNSSPALSLHIQSMKKSAFKMLCKFNILDIEQRLGIIVIFVRLNT